MKLIELTGNKFTKVDDEDYEWLADYAKWSFDRYAYCTRKIGESKKKRSIRMHRLIMKPPKGMVVDHINGDKLDNRKSNLRITTYSLNIMNRHKFYKTSNPFRGVYWDKSRNKWMALGCVNYRKFNLGRFNTPEEAAIAFNAFINKFKLPIPLNKI